MGLLLVFSAVYVPLLLSKAVTPAGVFDRYLLPLFPLGTIGFLRGFRQWMGRDRMPLASWFVLALFGFYGVAESHDYFAQLRTRLAVTQYLEQRGIPRTRIMAGFNTTCGPNSTWPAIATMHASRSRRGAMFHRPNTSVLSPSTPFGAGRPWCIPITSSRWRPHKELLATDVPWTDFWCWLPPFRRCVGVQARDPALAAVSRLPVQPAPSSTQ